MKGLTRFASWLALTLAAVAVQAAGRLPQSVEAKLDDVFKPWDKKDAPGGAVSVSVKGQVVYEKAFGMANLELDVPNKTTTIFDVGSVTKQFTATCALLLAEQGKFSIDDEAGKYLTEYPVLSENKITIRQLMSHTAGVRDYMSLVTFKTGSLAFGDDDVVETLKGQRTLDFPPGMGFSYSNSGYFLLKKLVEKESGKSLAVFAKESIFVPLGMDHTQILDDPAKLIHDRAFGYVDPGNGTGFRAGLSMIAADGAGGLWTDLDDMHKWTENWKHNKLGKADPKFFEQMQSKTKLKVGTEVPYGLAFFMDAYKGVRRIQHGGDFIGFHAQVSWYPDQDVTIVTMSNDGTQNAKTFNDQAAEVLLADVIKPDPSGAQKEVTLTEKELDDYTGRFDLNGAAVDVKHTGTQLQVQVTGQPQIDVYASEKDKFFYKVVAARIEFNRDAEGRVDSLTVFQGGATIKCPRAQPFAMPAEKLEALVGVYYSTELDVLLNLKMRDGALAVFSTTVLNEATIEAISEKKLNCAGITIDVERDGDLVKALLVNMPRATKMRFVRLSAE